MNPGLVVKLRPTGPWRIGPDSGARNRVDVIYHSDSLYSAVTAAMSRLGWLEEWLDATARTGASAVSFGSCYPFMDDINFVVPPRTVWPPSSNSAKAPRVRWRSARFVPLKVVQSILSGKRVDENQWSVDGPSDCLVPNGKPGPFRTAVRFSAGVDRLTGTAERHSTGCIEFRPGAGLWTVVSFRDSAAQGEWSDKVKAAFRLLADSGFGGERSRGWGRSEAPLFVEGMLPDLILPLERIKAAAVRERRQAAQLKVEVAAETPVVAAPVEEAPVVDVPVVETPLEAADRISEEVADSEGLAPASVAEPEETPLPDGGSFPSPAIAELAAEVPGFSHEEAAPVQTPGEENPEAGQPANEPVAEASAAPETDESSTLEIAGPVEPPQDTVAEAAAVNEGMPAAVPAAEETPSAESAPTPPSGETVPASHHPHWLLSVFTPAASDSVDWARGNYTVLARGGRIDSPVRSGELKKQIQMVAEGSVLYAESAPSGSAADVAPDGFAHPVFRAGFAVAIPLPEVS